MAPLGPREMSDSSPQSAPKRTLLGRSHLSLRPCPILPWLKNDSGEIPLVVKTGQLFPLPLRSASLTQQ
jgi:hypothetical protein